jgi:hypothetical protein
MRLADVAKAIEIIKKNIILYRNHCQFTNFLILIVFRGQESLKTHNFL